MCDVGKILCEGDAKTMMHWMITKAPEWGNFGKVMAAKKKDFYATAMLLIVKDIVTGIKEQHDITGGSFPALEPETIQLKGHDKALINKGLLSDEYTYEQVNDWRNDNGQITIKPISRALTRINTKGYKNPRDTPRDEVGVKLQIEGVESKSGLKLFMFFGVSKDAGEQVTKLMGQIAEEALNAL